MNNGTSLAGVVEREANLLLARFTKSTIVEPVEPQGTFLLFFHLFQPGLTFDLIFFRAFESISGLKLLSKVRYRNREEENVRAGIVKFRLVDALVKWKFYITRLVNNAKEKRSLDKQRNHCPVTRLLMTFQEVKYTSTVCSYKN